MNSPEGPGTQWFHYLLWEDWRNGMYGRACREPVIDDCRALLADPGRFGEVLKSLLEDWPIAAAQHLSNIYRNHQPSCGRLACSYEFGATIREVNEAWKQLTPQEQLAANTVADQYTFLWRTVNMQGQMQWPI